MAPAKVIWNEGSMLLERLKIYYYGKKIEDPPVITARTALICAVLFTVLYVAPFYLSPTLRATPLTSRDAPAVIKARVRAVGVSCVASSAIAVYIIVQYGHATVWDVLRLLGIWPLNYLDAFKVLSLVSILFLGPLYEVLVVGSGWRNLNFRMCKETFFDSPTGFRNNLISPVSEEFVFRSLVISLYLLAKVPPTRIVFTTPLIFGMAHVHHFFEFVQSRSSSERFGSLKRIVILALVRSLFQLAYTSLFGFFAAFVYLRTGNVFAAIVAHSFCNLMGFPRFWGKVGQDLEFNTATPDVAQGKRDDSLEAQSRVGSGLMTNIDAHEKRAANIFKSSPTQLGTQWTVAYYLLLGIGAYGFYRLLWPLTESTNTLATFWKNV